MRAKRDHTRNVWWLGIAEGGCRSIGSPCSAREPMSMDRQRACNSPEPVAAFAGGLRRVGGELGSLGQSLNKFGAGISRQRLSQLAGIGRRISEDARPTSSAPVAGQPTLGIFRSSTHLIRYMMDDTPTIKFACMTSWPKAEKSSVSAHLTS